MKESFERKSKTKTEQDTEGQEKERGFGSARMAWEAYKLSSEKEFAKKNKEERDKEWEQLQKIPIGQFFTSPNPQAAEMFYELLKAREESEEAPDS